MDFFINFPAEKIEEICKKLDNRSLANFMETSSRIHQICYDIYAERYLEHEEEEKEVDKLIDYIHKRNRVYFRHIINSKDEIMIEKNWTGTGYISYQFGFPMSVPCVLSEWKDYYIRNNSFYTTLHLIKKAGFKQTSK